MMIFLTLALFLISAVSSAKLSMTGYQFRWSVDRLNGDIAAPFMWNQDTKKTTFIHSAPVFWQVYTIHAQTNPTKYQGGTTCDPKQSCTDTGNTETVVWSFADQQYFTGKPAVINTKFSLLNEDPTQSTAVFKSYLGTMDQDVTTWPERAGMNGDYKNYILYSIWGLAPQSLYFQYLRDMYQKPQAMI